jgi:hypothetical protein
MRYVALLAVIALSSLAFACDDEEESAPTPTPQVQATATPVANACGPNPSPYTPVQPTDFSYRLIAAPQPNAMVQSPLTVSGDANPFEGAFSVTVFDANGQQVAAGDFNKSNLQLAFSVTLTFSVTAPTPACVWYHERSGNDGSPINITQVPVLLQP